MKMVRQQPRSVDGTQQQPMNGAAQQQPMNGAAT